LALFHLIWCTSNLGELGFALPFLFTEWPINHVVNNGSIGANIVLVLQAFISHSSGFVSVPPLLLFYLPGVNLHSPLIDFFSVLHKFLPEDPRAFYSINIQLWPHFFFVYRKREESGYFHI
jgi:hypothetical protein